MLNAPSIFGLSHILYVVITTIAIVCGCIIAKKYCQSEKSKNFVILGSAIALLVSVSLNRTLNAVYSNLYDEAWHNLLPTTFSGMTSFILSIFLIINFKRNKNHPILHGVVYIGIIAGIAATVYPDFLGQASSIFYPPTISSFVHHTLTLFVVALLFMWGMFKPTFKKWHCFYLALCVYLVAGMFMVHALGLPSAMEIYVPILPGLYWYIAGMIVAVLHVVMLTTDYFVRKKFKNNDEAKA